LQPCQQRVVRERAERLTAGIALRDVPLDLGLLVVFEVPQAERGQLLRIWMYDLREAHGQASPHTGHIAERSTVG
jgi:hypothetical protein